MAKFKYTKDQEYDGMRGYMIDQINKMKKAKLAIERITRSKRSPCWNLPESRLENSNPEDLPFKGWQFYNDADELRSYLREEIEWFEYALKYANKEELEAFVKNKLTQKQINDIQDESRWR